MSPKIKDNRCDNAGLTINHAFYQYNTTEKQSASNCKIVFHTSTLSHYFSAFAKQLNQEIPITILISCNYGWGDYFDPGFRQHINFGHNIANIPQIHIYNRTHTTEKLIPHYNHSIFSILKQIAPSMVVITSWYAFSDWKCFWLALSLKIPVVLRTEATSLFVHGSKLTYLLKKNMLKWLCKRASAIFSIGTKCTEFYTAIGIPPEKIFLTPYSVDNNFFIEQSKRWKAHKALTLKNLGMDPQLPTLLFSGKLIKRKRPVDALKVHCALLQKGIKTNLVFIGAGNLSKKIKTFCKQKNLINVCITGFKDQNEISQYYASGDIFLFPSSRETWGLVINEAMCFSLPIITTRMVSSSADLVVTGENGFIHNVGDITSMTNSVEYLLTNKTALDNFGKKSFDIISKWSIDACINGVKKCLAEICII